MSRIFDDYAVHGSVEIEHLGYIGNSAVLVRQMREMWQESGDPDQKEPDFNDLANQYIDEVVESVTNQIHGEVCECDDKRCPTPTEIADWLREGSFELEPAAHTLEKLVAAWREYTSQQ